MATTHSPAFLGHRQGQHNRSTQREPQPLPPCSPPSPDPSPTGDGETGLLPPGTEVEVRLDRKGYYGTWFEATIIGFAAASGRHASVRYSITFDGNGDIKRFAPTHVRPRPLPLDSPQHFHRQDVVEVFHERGWWSGLVLSTEPRSITVAFPITREVITYMTHLVRPRREYVDGCWVPSPAVVVVRPNHEIRMYEVGDKVEVVMEREAYGHSWFPAEVAKVIDEFSYIVEYSDQNGEESDRSEYLHWQFIRPAVQHLPPENEFHLQLGPGTAVEAYCDGAWSAARVHKILEDGKFLVRIKGKKGKQLMTKEVKLQYKWDGKDWNLVSAKRQAHFKQAVSSRKHRKSHVQVPHIHHAECSSAKILMRTQQKQAALVPESDNASVSKMGTPLSTLEISPASICPPNSSSPLYGYSTHPKTVVSENVQNQLERKKPILRKVYTSKKWLSKKNEDDFEIPHSLQGLLECSSMAQQIGVNQIAGSQGEPSLVLGRSESTMQQLDIILENAVNTNEVKYQEPVGVVTLASTSDDIDLDVLQEFPQQPHFLPLQHYTGTIQKGMKLGLKMAFNDCVRKIRKSSIADNEDSFEDIKSTLAELKKYGFDVQYFECLVDKLIKVKDEYNKHLEEKSAVQIQKEQIRSSSDRKGSLLDKIDKDIGELEKKLGLLREEGQRLGSDREHDEETLSGLKEVESNIKEELDDDVRKFNGILAEGLQQCLT